MRHKGMADRGQVLMLASVASMIDQFNMPNICLLSEMGYEVHVACNFREGNTCDRKRIRHFQAVLHDMRVVWHQWDCPRSIRPIRSCLAYRQLQGLLDRHQFVCIHCHSPVGGALARIVAHLRGIPVIYTAHGFHFYQGAPLKNWLLYYPAEKLLAYWTDVLITVNKEDYRFAKKNLKAGKIYYTPGVGVRLSQFQKRQPIGQERMQRKPAGQESMQEQPGWQGRQEHHQDFREKYRIPEGAVLLLSVGELSRRKNHQAAIAALAQLPEKDVYYLICGQGELKGELLAQARELGVAGRVRMPGYLENVAQLYQGADIFVFPSIQEGMPAALMEAMAAGMPCVVSDIRGSRELVGEDARADLTHPQQLRSVLGRMVADERFRDRCSTYNKMKIQGFSLDIVQERMKAIYRDTLCL